MAPKCTLDAVLELSWRSLARTSRRIQAFKWRPSDAKKPYSQTGVKEAKEQPNWVPKCTFEALLEHVWKSPGRTSRRIQVVKWRPGDAEKQFGAPGTSQDSLTGVQETREHANGAPTAQKEDFEALLGDIWRRSGSTSRSIQAWYRHPGDQKRQF